MTAPHLATPYLVISPCRDEQQFAQRTIDAMVAQTARPAKWIIVDDGSSDQTPEIVGRAAATHDWISVITRPPRATRVLGSGVVHAFNEALATENLGDYDFVSKLDMDLDLPPTYFEELLRRFAADPRLGTASGRPHVAVDGDLTGDDWQPERGASEMSAGMAKLYRVTAFREIGGLVPEIMWDGIDCHEARVRGWRSRSFDDPRTDFKHLRPEGGSDRGVLRGRRRHGYGQWFMGTDPAFMLASALVRVRDEPAVVGSVHMLAGYLGAVLRRVPQHGTPEFRRQLRRFQRESMVLGKTRATARWEHRAASRWGRSGPRLGELVSQQPTMSHTFITAEIASLTAAGLDVVAITLRSGDEPLEVPALQRSSVPDVVRAVARVVASPRAAWAGLRAVTSRGPAPEQKIGLAYLLQAALLLRVVDEQGLGHLHVHFANNAAEVARLAVVMDRARGGDLTWSLTVHGLWMHGLGLTGDEAFPHRNERRWGALATKLRDASAVVCIDDQSRARLATLVPAEVAARIVTIRLGVNTQMFSPDTDAPDRDAPDSDAADSAVFTVVSVGRLAAEKDLPTLVEACAGLSVPWRLLIAGTGPEQATVEAVVDRFGVRDQVSFLGRVEQHDLPALYRQASVVAQTSLSEGVPVVLMEAMACGRAVVATRVGGIPELITDGESGQLVPPRDAAAVTAALQRVASDPDLAASQGAAGRRRVLDGHDLVRNGEQLATVLRGLIR